MDTEIHPSYQNLSSHSSTSSMDWETTSVDTDILTLETDRTLMETERTLREVEQSIEESRRASRALRRARRELESDVPAASRRGVSLDRGTSDRGFGSSHSFDSRPIMSFTNVPVQGHFISNNRGVFEAYKLPFYNCLHYVYNFPHDAHRAPLHKFSPQFHVLLINVTTLT